MNHCYSDIMDKIAEPPTWFDENAVPRYCTFAPNAVANIYADQVALVRIECQACARVFVVAVSTTHYVDAGHSLVERVKAKNVGYGDPPNVGCCAGGPTMNSVERRVLEFWELSRVGLGREWTRRPDLEIDVEPEWATSDPWTREP